MNEKITCIEILSKINSEIKHSSNRYLLIFDLDDTIFDTSYRRHFIYENFLKEQFKLPNLHFNFHRKYYNFPPLIEKCKFFQENNLEILKIFLNFYISESYLHLDIPFFGVSQFFNHLSKIENKVFFLTGRNKSTMQMKTYQLLQKYRLLSHHNNQNYLIMKKNTKIPDKLFKVKELKYILNQFPENKIIIIDNESENCKIFEENLPNDSLIVRFNSVQKKKCDFDGFILENWYI